ncbi:MAG TPA: OmpA family protein, partial [Gammaproteobacteria bacterium]|nr:OmpA family protein [Gammaproteobacteria bacterium]
LFGFGGADPVGILIADPSGALFDDTIVGATGNSLTFTFTNNGSAPVTLGAAAIDPGFNITANNCESGKVLAPGDSCEVAVQFEPVATGLNATNLTIDSSAGPASASMAGEGLPSPEPVLSAAPDTVVLPTTPVNSASAAGSATLSNIGESPLTISQISLDGPAPNEFTIDDSDCADKTLAPGESCTLKASFNPTREGLSEAAAVVTSDGGDQSIRLVGFATPALAGKLETDPLVRGFANTALGQEDGPQPVIVTNVGTLKTAVTDTRIEGANADDFKISSDTCKNKTLAPAEECRIKISFKPTAVGARTGVLVVASDEGEARTDLSGFGAAGPTSDISVAPEVLAQGLDLGTVLVGETGDQQTIAIENRGTAPLIINELNVADPDQFVVDGSACTDKLLAARSACELKVSFKPIATGPQSTTLTIRSDDPTQPILTVGLRGVGSSGDRDHDGLPDNIEEAGPTDPDNPDTDSDGLLDGVEDANHNGVFDEGETNPVDDDTDNDFILDGKEDRNHDGLRQDSETDPRIPDTDGDGIIDGVEDANHDGLFSFGETDPLKVDTDKDGIPDGIEDANHNGLLENGETDPRVSETAVAGVEGGEVVETGIDGGAGALGLPLLTLVGGLAAFRRRRLATLLALPLLLLASSAYSAEDNFYLGIGAGLSNLQPDRNGTIWFVTDDQDVGYKAFLGYDFRDFLSIEGYYSDLGSSELTAAPTVGHIDYQAFGLNSLWYFPNNLPGLQAFLKLGIGKIDTQSDKVPFRQVENTQLTAGAGVEWLFKSGLGLRLDYDYLDQDAQLVSLNLLKRFARPHKAAPAPVIADLDEDGVPDKDDQCPNTQLGVSVDANGCAPKPKDSDGDGVTDDKDQCPNTAAGVPVNNTGCPRDSDGDGVIDSNDQCPATPTGVKVNASGCPLDSDGDGVLDASDKCPATPAGTEVDNVGCKIVVVAPPEPPPVERFTGVLEGVNFFTGSARLTPLAKIKLDGIAKQLLEYPDAKILVVGHTDSRGSAAANKKLSIDRAHTVATYLVRKGLPASQIRYTGKGESQPIASNATEKGRALNRRVELVVR